MRRAIAIAWLVIVGGSALAAGILSIDARELLITLGIVVGVVLLCLSVVAAIYALGPSGK